MRMRIVIVTPDGWCNRVSTLRFAFFYLFEYFLILSSVAIISKRMTFQEIFSFPAHKVTLSSCLHALKLSAIEGFSIGKISGLLKVCT